ncbi:vesicle transport protein SEC20-like [Musca vetustissima]|uniref:vesicle transport protein SEC20-like n=1 Tax=Musca vetustissima TaxID=27455 RepID=UPI002AB609DE|nr:vesicle transport protein SEC20-like [Musca vetustissima]XP_061398634.1 vesicle transport protein SEC20-like [Musca vetustissima]
MNIEKYTLQSIRQELIDNNLQAKAIIQDIITYRGSIQELEALNEAGRAKLAALRKNIDRLNDWARDTGDPALSKEVDTQREQFSKVLQAFRKANVATMLEIEKANREELMAITGETDLRQRHTAGTATRHNRGSLVTQENNVTEKMLAISRHLSETTQKSAITLENLVASSQNVEATRDELTNTAGTISQSGKLLKKYGRRECTDKMLLFFAFAFFLACVFYIIHKRLF